MRSVMRKFFGDDRGATATEYAMLIIFIALAIAGGATLLGNNISNLFSSIGASLTSLTP
jgi:pilus assembly protein Flp/PilA